MDNNENLHDAEVAKKRSLKTVLLVCLVLLPTLFALILAALIADGFTFGASKSLYEIKLYDTAGRLIAEESAYLDEAEKGSVVALFSPITTGFAQTTELPETLNKAKHFRAVISYEGYTDEYVFYLSTSDDVGYCTVNGKKHYRLSDESVHNILSSKFAELFYKTAVPPTLYSSSGDVILPDSVAWRYKVASGEYFKSNSYELAVETTEYVMAGTLSIFFSAEPDICIITVSQNGTEYYSGSYADLPWLNINRDEPVSVVVEAEWEHKEEGSYHGRINYSFNAMITEKPYFSIAGRTPDVNSFFIIKATNIDDVSKLRVSSVPHISHSIDFCGTGNSVVAMVPVTEDMAGEKYTITVSYGVVSDIFEVSVPEAVDKSIIVISSATSDEFVDARTAEAEAELDSLVSFAAANTLTEKLYSGEFLDITEMGATQFAKLGDYYRVGNSSYYKGMGNEYRFDGRLGIGVPALNNGRVLKTGYHVRLGNYVIVSHGAGLATWYSHLSVVDVTEGQYVARGEIVGKTGSTGLSGDDNVTVCATVGDAFIDVTYLVGKEY